MNIQTLDLGHFIEGTPEQRKGFVDGLLRSFDDSGFVKLVNHGFDQDELTELFNWSKNFFDLPLEIKNEIPNETGPRPMRGYTPSRLEYVSKLHKDAKIRAMSDSKEHFDQGAETDTEYPNKWSDHPSMEGFRPFMEAFYRQCDTVCLELVKAIEVGFDVEQGSLVKRCIPAATDLRLTHYPEITLEEMLAGHTSRIAPHSDFGIVTLLFQDSCGGLEVEDRERPGHYLPIPPTDTTEMIVNVGDTLERWTNAKLTGGVHRVSVPQGITDENGATTLNERFSMAYLFKAERNMSVGPLPQFMNFDKENFPSITALEFQKWRNNTLYT